MTGSLASAQSIAVQIMRRESIFLGPSYVIRSLRSNICAFSRESGIGTEFRAWVARDRRSEEKVMVFMRSGWLSLSLARAIDRRQQKGLEMSLATFPLQRLDYAMASRASSQSVSQSVRECVSNSITYPQHEDWQPGMHHYSSLILVSVSAFTFSLFVLLIERLFSRIYP
jgi:hypothetical protein